MHLNCLKGKIASDKDKVEKNKFEDSDVILGNAK